MSENVGVRPNWLSPQLFPFTSRWFDADGARVHYVDEGEGPPLLLLHGNPTYSLLYREIVKGLRDRYRCIAVDYPGFGLSSAPAGYGFTPAEHAGVLERLVTELDLRDVTMMTQDWGGPIGFAVAGRHPERFSAFVVGNTFAWPMDHKRGARIFSRVLGGPVGGYLILRRNFFVEFILPRSLRRAKLSEEVMEAYRGPFPTPESRRPLHVFPREIVGSTPFLAEVERGLAGLRNHPALILWPDKDPAFTADERRRWEGVFGGHRTIELTGAGHYIQEDAPREIVAAIRDWR
jgi:haloalkane dehalogenase